jgi:hypothetical protein
VGSARAIYVECLVRGSFEVEWLECPTERVPSHVTPLREERRE